MPSEIIHAFALLKKAAAETNCELGKLSQDKCQYIVRACDEILAGGLTDNFPLVVWQTGSGTQTNMNLNEVIAGYGNHLAGQALLHPNDDVNMSQSSNDTFPTAMHISAVIEIETKLYPAIEALIETFKQIEIDNADVIKIGRTHLQDATPLKFAQEVSGW